MLVLSLLPLLLATVGFAAPTRRESKVPASALKLPPNEQQLVAPTEAPRFVTLGVGNQNYTCSASGTYTSTGAVVQVFDIAGLYSKPEFTRIQDDAFVDWANFPCNDPYDQTLAELLKLKYGIPISGQHYFIQDDKGLSPVWDFRADGPTKGNPDAIIVAAPTGSIPSPTGPPNVDWVELKNVSGKLASKVFRVYTVAGDPPSSCTPGSEDIVIKFTTQYFLYGGEV